MDKLQQKFRSLEKSINDLDVDKVKADAVEEFLNKYRLCNPAKWKEHAHNYIEELRDGSSQ